MRNVVTPFRGKMYTPLAATSILYIKSIKSRILAPEKDIIEVKNAIEVYDILNNFKPLKLKSLLDAHKILMKGLIPNAGKFRSGNVGIVKGSKITHVAPLGNMVTGLLNNLLDYVK